MKEFLIVGLSSLVALCVCHFLTSSFSRRAEEGYQKGSDQIAFVYQQITELYQPLLSLLQKCRDLERSTLRQAVGDPALAVRLEEEQTGEESVCAAFVLSEQILQLVLQKAALLDAGRLPYSFQQLVEYHQAWKFWMKSSLADREAEGVSQRFPVWPELFEQEMAKSYNNLQQCHLHLLQDMLVKRGDCSIRAPFSHSWHLGASLFPGRRMLH